MNNRYSFPISPLEGRRVDALQISLPSTSDPLFSSADFIELENTYDKMKGGWRKDGPVPSASSSMRRLLALKPGRGQRTNLQQEFAIISALAQVSNNGSATDISTAAFRSQTHFLLTLQQILAGYSLWNVQNYQRLKRVTTAGALFQMSIELQNFTHYYDVQTSHAVQSYLEDMMKLPAHVASLSKVLNLFHEHGLGKVPAWVFNPDSAHRLPLLARLIDFSMKNQLSAGIRADIMMNTWQGIFNGDDLQDDFRFEGVQQSITSKQVTLPNVFATLQAQDAGGIALREYAEDGLQGQGKLTLAEVNAVMQSYNQNRGLWKRMWAAIGWMWMSQSTAMRKLDLQLVSMNPARGEAARGLSNNEEFNVITAALGDERSGTQTQESLRVLKEQHQLVFQMAKALQQADIFTPANYTKWRNTFGTEHYYRLTSAIIDFFSKTPGLSRDFLQSAFKYLVDHANEADHVVDFLRICAAEGFNPNNPVFDDVGQHDHYVALYHFIHNNNIEGFSLDAIAVHSKVWRTMPDLNELQSLVHIGAISLKSGSDTLKILSNCRSDLTVFLQHTKRLRAVAGGPSLGSFKYLLEVMSKQGDGIETFANSYLALVANEDSRQLLYAALDNRDEAALLEAIRNAVPEDDRRRRAALDGDGPNFYDDLHKEFTLRNESKLSLDDDDDIFTPYIEAAANALVGSPVADLYRDALLSENDRAAKNLVELLGNIVQSAIENGMTDFAALSNLMNVDKLHNLVFLMVGKDRERIINPDRIGREEAGCGNPSVGFLVALANKFHLNKKDYTSALTLVHMLQEKNIFSETLQHAIIEADNIDVIDLLHDFFHQMEFDFESLDQAKIATLWQVIPDVPKFPILLEFQQSFSLDTNQVVAVLENTGKNLNTFLIQARDVFIKSRPEVALETKQEVFMHLSGLLQHPKGVERLTQLVTIYQKLTECRPELRNDFFNKAVIDRLIEGLDKEEHYFKEVVHVIQANDKGVDIMMSGIMDFSDMMSNYGFSSQAIFELADEQNLSLERVEQIKQTTTLWMSRYRPASYTGAHQDNVDECDSDVMLGNQFEPAKTDKAYWKFNKSKGMVETGDIHQAVLGAKSMTGQSAMAPSDRMFQWLIRTACEVDARVVADNVDDPSAVIVFPKAKDAVLDSVVYLASAKLKAMFDDYKALVNQAAAKYGVVASGFYTKECGGDDAYDLSDDDELFAEKDEEAGLLSIGGARGEEDEDLEVDEGPCKLLAEIQDRKQAIIGLAQQGLFGIQERDLDISHAGFGSVVGM